MNWIKKIIRPLLLFGLPLVVIACTVSYKFNGSSINYDKVKTISIADFPIKSEYVYAPLATKFNEDLKDIFIRVAEVAEHLEELSMRIQQGAYMLLDLERRRLETLQTRIPNLVHRKLADARFSLLAAKKDLLQVTKALVARQSHRAC